jgi:spore coat protein U-like protein
MAAAFPRVPVSRAVLERLVQRSVKYLPPLVLAAAGLFPAAAGAVTCTVSTVPVAFGAYDPTSSTPTDGVGTIKISCDKAPALKPITISAGGSGIFTNRVMKSGSWNLNYNLYTSAARTLIWGSGTGGTGSVNYGGSGTGPAYTITVYGRIPASQNVGAGSYSDSLIVTISF